MPVRTCSALRTQLYFERQAVLFAIAALPDDADPVGAERLGLRARELAAGLDGWTGGWFGRSGGWADRLCPAPAVCVSTKERQRTKRYTVSPR